MDTETWSLDFQEEIKYFDPLLAADEKESVTGSGSPNTKIASGLEAGDSKL